MKTGGDLVLKDCKAKTLSVNVDSHLLLSRERLLAIFLWKTGLNWYCHRIHSRDASIYQSHLLQLGKYQWPRALHKASPVNLKPPFHRRISFMLLEISNDKESSFSPCNYNGPQGRRVSLSGYEVDLLGVLVLLAD